MDDSNVFKLGVGMILGYPRSDVVLGGWKIKGQG